MRNWAGLRIAQLAAILWGKSSGELQGDADFPRRRGCLVSSGVWLKSSHSHFLTLRPAHFHTDPPLPLLALPFPGVVPRHGGSVPLRPRHHHGIAFTGGAPKPLS